MTENQKKELRIREFLRNCDVDALLLSLQSNFAWATGGKQNYVGIASEMGVASLLITQHEKYVITNKIEKFRIMDEELAGMGYELIEFDWYDESQKASIVRNFSKTMKIGSDDGSAGTENIADDIAELRYSLTEEEIKKYQWLGKRSGEAISEVCQAIKVGDTEHQIAARLASILIPQGIMPIVRLIAADDRVYKYRHPIPTDKQVEKYAMVVLCARKYGLITSVTRLVHFGKLPDELRKKHDAVVKVDAAFIGSSRPGISAGEIFEIAQKTYAEVGYADEWTFHHQGGPTGYAARDYKATPSCPKKLVANQALAWNPSIAGTKSEDTVIITTGETNIITESPNWPTLSVEFNGKLWKRADILCK